MSSFNHNWQVLQKATGTSNNYEKKLIGAQLGSLILYLPQSEASVCQEFLRLPESRSYSILDVTYDFEG